MCGFVGFFSNEEINSADKKMLYAMNTSIKHRGPDDDGMFCDDNIILAFRRLSIIALDSGKQPFSYDNDRYHLIFNGEIYNYIELRNDLIKEGIEFSTDSEAEVILASYKHRGKDFVKQLRGMFAFIIWDRVDKKILAARDPFGIKPFYYVDTEDGLYFSSELKSFTYNPDTFSREIDSQSLHNYLTFQFVPEPNTIVKDIKILPAGYVLEKELNKESNIEKYFNIEFNPVKETKEEKTEKIRNVLEESVAFHMRSDVPVGCFLSGGIDSTIVAMLAKKTNPNIKTFTVGFKINGYSEIQLAKDTAKALGVENISKTITCEEFIRELPNIIWHMDGPVADPSSIPIYFISKEAKKHVKVILSGEGSDEFFGGYNIYHEPKSLEMFSHIPSVLKSALKNLASVFPEGMKGKSFIDRGCTPIEERFVGNAKIFKDNEKSEYLSNYNKDYTYTKVTKPLYDTMKDFDDVTKMQYVDMNMWLKGDILVKSDRMSMANSLELRVPFLDKEVFRVASTLTLDDKIHDNTTKYMLREAFKDDLPKEVTVRRKLGYPVPIRVWLKDEMYDWARNLIIQSKTDEYINKENVLKLLDAHKTGSVDYSRKLWTLITFILWHKIYIEDIDKYLQRQLTDDVAMS